MEVGMHPVLQMRDEWTVADLEALGLEDWRRYEIVDGALVVSPSAGNYHELVSARLRQFLLVGAPPGIAVVGPLAIGFGRSYRIPDLLVLSEARLRDPRILGPQDVLLAVEVVSPGSLTQDRITKPAQYAAAGIAHFWRVETDPVSLSAYVLDGATYRELGTWSQGQTAVLDAPFPVRIEIDDLG